MTDPYEQQLLAVFESCDVAGTGRLDREGLVQLCNQLHLEDGRSQLMDCLLPAFTFDQFRDALLTLLGASRRHSSDIERETSPDREVSPKFVFGQKKYGRRSRPESTDQEGNESDGDFGDEDNEDGDTFLPGHQNSNDNSKDKLCSILIDDFHSERPAVTTPTSVHSIALEKEEMESPRGQGEAELRSASHRLGVGLDGFLDQSELAMVCRAVGMEKMADEVVKQVFAKLNVDAEGRISFEEFLQLFRGSHTPPTPTPTSHAPTTFQQQQHLTSLDITSSGYVNIDSLVDLWEAGGVLNPSAFLLDLGLSGSGEVSLTSVATILDEEIRSMASKSVGLATTPQVNALTAALSLAQAQAKWSRSCLEQMTGERDKLHSDLSEANQRAALLAHEVDDRHARMERASQMQIKLLEQRHTEQVKQLTAQLTLDRDQLTGATLRLEKRLADQQEEENKLRAELTTLQAECEVMEKENQSLSEQLRASELVRSRVERDSQQTQQLNQRVQELESASEQVQSLVEQLTRLQAENTGLRDRNDELTLQLENLTTRTVCKRQSSSGSLDSGSGGGGGGTKRRGHSPLTLPPESAWHEESPRLGKVRRYCTDTDTDLSLDTVPMEGLAIGRSLRHSESGLEADLDTLDNSLTLSLSSQSPPSHTDKLTFHIGAGEEAYIQEIERLRASVATLQQANEQYKTRLVEVNQYLKGSLDMKNPLDEGAVPQVVDDHAALKVSPLKLKEEESSGSYVATLATESTEVQTSLDNESDVNRLEKHCHELRHTLENVQGEIVKILSEKKACTEENCVLKQRIEELSKRLPRPISEETISLDNTSGPLTFTVSTVPVDDMIDSPKNIALKCFPFMNHKQSNSDSPYCLFPKKDNGGFKFENLSQFAFELSQSLNDSNFSDSLLDLGSKPLSPCLSAKCDTSVNRQLEFGNDSVKDKTETKIKSDDLKELRELNAELREKCGELETSLELMRVEYEKCEDYWQGKLNEERAIFDQEQRLSDEKFAELEMKIQEYAELFSVEDKKNGRLPTIDEKDSLEKQVTDLEEEFEEFRETALKESLAKTEKINKLESEIEELKKSKKPEVLDTGVQTTEEKTEFRLHEPRTSPHSKVCLPMIEVTGPSSMECCCSCHTSSRKSLVRLRDTRSRLQVECDLLQRRREAVLHQLSQLHQRTNMLYAPVPDRRLASDVEMFHNLSSRLRHQELRCRHLQSALKHHQRHTDKLLHDAWEQHKADLNSIQKTLHNTQEKLLQQTRLGKQQMERLAASDVLVKDLYKENAHLSALVQKLEEQNLFVDQSILASTV